MVLLTGTWNWNGLLTDRCCNVLSEHRKSLIIAWDIPTNWMKCGRIFCLIGHVPRSWLWCWRFPIIVVIRGLISLKFLGRVSLPIWVWSCLCLWYNTRNVVGCSIPWKVVSCEICVNHFHCPQSSLDLLLVFDLIFGIYSLMGWWCVSCL